MCDLFGERSDPAGAELPSMPDFGDATIDRNRKSCLFEIALGQLVGEWKRLWIPLPELRIVDAKLRSQRNAGRED